MKRYTSFGLLALLLAVTPILASCAGAGSGGSEQGSNESEEDTQSMEHGDMGSEMLMENGEYSDERFIDAMVLHHQGAIDIAEVALERAEHPELRQLAENVIVDQEAEIEELRSIKEQEFGDLEVPPEMSFVEMEMMGTMQDPRELEREEAFDQAFIDAMIPHHESAISMAEVANEESGNPRIQNLAQRIIEAQESEIEQMTEWREEWYPGS